MPRIAPNQPVSEDDSLIATAVRVAAIEEMALEPARRSEVVSRVAGVRTSADAVAFLREVEEKMESARVLHG